MASKTTIGNAGVEAQQLRAGEHRVIHLMAPAVALAPTFCQYWHVASHCKVNLTMRYGHWLLLGGALLILSTMKLPTWLGGPSRRYDADDMPTALMNRAIRQRLGMYIIYAGAYFWVFGI